MAELSPPLQHCNGHFRKRFRETDKDTSREERKKSRVPIPGELSYIINEGNGESMSEGAKNIT